MTTAPTHTPIFKKIKNLRKHIARPKIAFFILAESKGNTDNRIVYYMNGKKAINTFSRDFRDIAAYLDQLSYKQAYKEAKRLSKESGLHFEEQPLENILKEFAK